MYRKKKIPSIYLWVSIISSIIMWCVIWIGIFFTNDTYRIQHVRYTLQSINRYNNIDMYSTITSYLSGESLRYRSLVWYSDIVSSVRQTFPYIETVSLEAQWPSDIRVDITFIDPPLIIQHNDTRRAIYSWWYTLPLYSWNTLGITSKTIRLPIYLTGLSSLSGLFFDTSFDKLFADRMMLDPFVMSWWFVSYIPGGEKYILVNGPYRYYFNAKKELQPQIDTLLSLKENYKEFNRLEQIDIGSLNYPIIHQ